MDGRSHSSVRVLVRPPTPPPRSQNGVVVVGFIGNRSDDVAHLMNKVIDSNVFGSGNLDTLFKFDDEQEISKWLESKKFSFYHDVEKGILYVQFSGSDFNKFGFQDQEELGFLQGLLFMFSVCHVVINIQEGSRFDTRVLQKFRIVQAAKNALSSSSKSQNVPSIASRHRSSPGNPSPGKTRSRNGSTATIMSALGTYTSLLPGQCTPVILFVFLDDFTDIYPIANPEEPSESPINSSTTLNSSSRPGPLMKGPSPVVVLARPANKSETGLRKKLQSSLEAQIRFSIKKCRILSVSSPLFSLDASKAVSLIDVSSCQSGESLEFAISLVEEVLDGKATPDSLLLDSHQHNGNKEDILSLKEFIYRQSDILRGRTGSVSTTSSGSGGVGMVAVAAAAAAASASSGNAMKNVQELPSKEIWLSSCQLILHGIIHEKSLENGIGMNHRFSDMWCERAFPVAKEIYLNGLAPCYTSSKHDDHLRKALLSLTSMVKGPAVRFYMEKLKNECNSIWSGGRQQCDAVSLTGKPCVHLRHEVETHSSGYVYLHACACGRSRSLRPDPFDYETANVCNIADCDKLLPTSQFLEGSFKGTSHWNMIRIGTAKYYDPSKGLVQSGFSATQKFLLRWIISEKLNEVNHSLNNDFQQISLDSDSNTDITVDGDKQMSNLATAGKIQSGIDLRLGPTSDDVSQTKNASFSKGLSNFTMKKPFSEVVAGSAASNSAFPPLFSRKQLLQDSDRNVKLHQGPEKSREPFSNQESENGFSIEKKLVDNGIAGDRYKDGNPILQIGSNVIPLNTTGKQINGSDTMKHVTAYVGFEHECPRGHRFILNLDHVNELGSSYAVSEENTAFSMESLDKKKDYYKFNKFGRQGGTRRQFPGEGISKSKSLEKLKEKVGNGNMNFNKSAQSTRQRQNGKLKMSHSVKDLDSDDKTVMDDVDCVFQLLNRSLPLYMYCPHCRDSLSKYDTSDVKFASTISQLQRIFVVTPSFPIVLAADPIIQFELSCLPSSVPDREQKLQFSLGCPVILPPDSFISLRLPFVYGVTMEDGSVQSLKPFENEPHLTAWVLKGTSLQVVSQTSKHDLGAAT